ncbi:MAG: lipo-like protein [Mariprofundaceae bacterium]
MNLVHLLREKLIAWLTGISPHYRADHFADFEALKATLKPGDVLLVEGETRVARIIQLLTRSNWSHAALYVGDRAIMHPDAEVRQHAEEFGEEAGELLLEADIETGVALVPLSRYRTHPVRVCRPVGIEKSDWEMLLNSLFVRLCEKYDTAQMLDLLRYLLPFGHLPARLAQKLWMYRAGTDSRTICSTMIVEAFQAVRYPVLPEIPEVCFDKGLCYRVRNARLFVPADFDHSPFFRVIKHQGVDHPRFNEEPFKPELIHWA